VRVALRCAVGAIAAMTLALGVPGIASAAPPFVGTGGAQSTSATNVTLNGFVDPNGINTSYHFEYALAASTYCTTDGTSGTHTDTPIQQILGSAGETDVAANVSGLTSGADYCFQLVANNLDGTEAGGLSLFKAGAPTASTFDYTITGASTVSLVGSANASGQSGTTVEIQYGPASSPWCQSGAASGSPPSTTTAVPFNFSDAQDHDVSLGLTGLTPGTLYCAVIVARNASGASNPAFETLEFYAGLPFAFTNDVVSTGASTANVTGEVNPSGQTTTVYAGYGTAASQWCQDGGDTGSPTSTTTPQPVNSTGTGYVDVTVGLSGLTPGTQYCVQLFAVNGSGTSRPSGTLEFTAGLPLVDTYDAESTGGTTANVNGAINPAGQTTTYVVRYDTANSTFCQDGTGPATNTTAPATLGFTDSSYHDVTVGLTGLTPGTTYCALLVATNPVGTVEGGFPVEFIAGAPTVVTDDVVVTSSTAATVSGSVNPSGQSTSYRARYSLANSTWCQSGGASGSPSNQTTPVTLGFTDSTPHDVTVQLTGLTTGATYCADIQATNPSGAVSGGTINFTVALLPVVDAGTATATGATTERVTGTVNPNGSATNYVFQYDLNNSTWCTSGGTTGSPANATAPAGAGSGSAPQNVQADLSALTPGATYCWALSATSTAGTTKDGPTGQTFVVGLPNATTQAATGVADDSATLNGQVNPQGNPTSFSFGWALTSSTWCSSNGANGSPLATTNQQPVGFTDTSPHAVSAVVSGLTAGSSYCFRVFASNAAGEATGGFLTFTTTGGGGGGNPTPTPTVTPTVTPTATPTATPTVTPTAKLGKLGGKAKVVGKNAQVKLGCLAGATCKGSLSLTAKLAGKVKPVGKAGFTIAPGTTGTVPVKLASKALKALKKGKLKVTGTARAGTQKVSRSITLVPKK
jgi:hypothetical protein